MSDKILIDEILADSEVIDVKRRENIKTDLKLQFQQSYNKGKRMILDIESKELVAFKNIRTGQLDINSLADSELEKRDIEEKLVVVKDLYKKYFNEDLVV